jgi:hypothetical protein
MNSLSFRSFLTIAAGAGLLSLAACKQILEVKPLSVYSTAEAFANVTNATSTVTGVYSLLEGDNGYGSRLSTSIPFDADDMINSPGEPDGGRRDIARYRMTAGTTEFQAPFTQLYQGVERANICIKNIPLMDLYKNGTPAQQQTLRGLLGEALVLRAQFYHEIVRNWGDVPAPFTPSESGQDFNLAPTDRNVIYDQLLADLAQASRLLPWRTVASYTTERFTKGAAKALRARLALTRGGYSSRQGQMVRAADYLDFYRMARAECDTLLQNRNQHTLNPNFETLWRNINEFRLDATYGEMMFEVAMAGGNASNDSKLGFNNGPRLDQNSRWGQTGGAINVLPTYYYAFDSVDTRRDVTVTLYTSTSSAPNIKAAAALTSMTDGKFRRDWRVPLLPGTSNTLGYNWPLLRFSDVLLMYAEADNELNGAPSAAAKAAFEEVRKRAYGAANASKIGVTPTDKAGFFNAIVRERGLEFGSEGIRKYDLVRWNLLGTKIAEAKANLAKLRDGVAPYNTVPLYVFTRVVNEQGVYLRSLYRPWTTTTVPASSIPGTVTTRINWRQALVAQLTGATPNAYINGVATYYVPNTGDELFPFPQTVLDSNPNLKQNFGY